MENYEALEGIEIQWTDGPRSFTAIVAACDREIGLTLVNKNNTKQNLTCLVAPGIQNTDQDHFYEMFDASIPMIKDGHYHCSVTDDIFYGGDMAFGGGMADCAFK